MKLSDFERDLKRNEILSEMQRKVNREGEKYFNGLSQLEYDFFQ